MWIRKDGLPDNNNRGYSDEYRLERRKSMYKVQESKLSEIHNSSKRPSKQYTAGDHNRFNNEDSKSPEIKHRKSMPDQESIFPEQIDKLSTSTDKVLCDIKAKNIEGKNAGKKFSLRRALVCNNPTATISMQRYPAAIISMQRCPATVSSNQRCPTTVISTQRSALFDCPFIKSVTSAILATRSSKIKSRSLTSPSKKKLTKYNRGKSEETVKLKRKSM